VLRFDHLGGVLAASVAQGLDDPEDACGQQAEEDDRSHDVDDRTAATIRTRHW